MPNAVCNKDQNGREMKPKPSDPVRNDEFRKEVKYKDPIVLET